MPHSVLGVQFIYVIIIGFIAFCTAHFYVTILTPRKRLSHPFIACFILCWMLLAPVAWLTFHYAWLGSFWIFIGYSIPAIVLFSGRLSLRLSAFFFALVTYISTELIPAGLIMVGSALFAHQILYPKELLLDGNILFALFYTFCNSAVLWIALHALTSAFRKQFQYFQPRTVIYLTIPFFIIMVMCNTLIICTNYIQYVLATVLNCVTVAFCLYLVSKGLNYLQHQEFTTMQTEKQVDHLQQQLNYYQTLNTHFSKLRRWKHDTANNLTAVSFLLEMHKYDEAIAYLENLVSNTPIDEHSDNNRVGGSDQLPSSHTTVRTVRYTAVSIVDVHRLIGCG